MIVTIDDFELYNATAEFRYKQALNLWDRAGVLWTQIQSETPSLRGVNIQPNEATFRTDSTQFIVALERASFHWIKPTRSLTAFASSTARFIGTVTEMLEIEQFTRIAIRLIYRKVVPSIEIAARMVQSSGLLILPAQRIFGQELIIDDAAVQFRLQSEQSGVLVRLRSEQRKFQSDLPIDWDGSDIATVEKSYLLFDLDFFVSSNTAVDQLKVEDWIKHITHMVNRDSVHILDRVS